MGAGYLGIEMAEVLLKAGHHPVLVEKRNQILPAMDSSISQQVHDKLVSNGARIFTDTVIDRFISDTGSVTGAWMSNKEFLPLQMALVCAGIRPNTLLAQKAGIQLGIERAIHVNHRMETNIPRVYAGGDCTDTIHVVSGESVYFPLGTTANKQGRIAGQIISGHSAAFKGITGTAILRVFDLVVARTGIMNNTPGIPGSPHLSATITHTSKAHFWNDSIPVTVKLTADRKTGRLLGAEIAGNDPGKRIDTIATALFNRMTVRDIVHLDLAYAPPLSPVWDPVLMAARVLEKQIK
jgi:NADPH-dependent 2,4-dienoyl-CoA reductase/sulfur reductase-like enzyme